MTNSKEMEKEEDPERQDFENFLRPWSKFFEAESFPGETHRMPATNISEDRDQFTLFLAVPGVKKEDFQIDLKGRLLTIRGERKEEQKARSGETFPAGATDFPFNRSFTLPEEVNTEKISARYDHGVLQVVLPKTTDALKKTGTETRILVIVR